MTASQSNLRLATQPSFGNMSQHSGMGAGLGQQNTGRGSMYTAGGAPQIGAMPFVPYGGGPGSVAGSEFAAGGPFMNPMQTGSAGPFGTPSMYGMPMMGAGGSQISGFGGFGAGTPPVGMGAPGMARPMSTFSMATTMNPFMSSGPNMNENPSDEDIMKELRMYLMKQDLMNVTKAYVLYFCLVEATY